MPRSFDREAQHFERHAKQSANELAGLLAVLGINLAPAMWNAIKNNRNLEEKVHQWAQRQIDEYTEDQKWRREREPKPRRNQKRAPRPDDPNLRNPFYNPETGQGHAYKEVNSDTPPPAYGYPNGDPRNVEVRHENIADDFRNVIFPSNLKL